MDIPVLDMIARSGWVARVVLLVLAVFSLASWVVIFYRAWALSSVSRLHRRFRRVMDDTPRVSDAESLDKRILRSPMGQLGLAAAAEFRRIGEDAQALGAARDVAFYLNSQFDMARDRMEAVITAGRGRLDQGLVLLALMSSASPFLGLFGTVWGVMNSFFEIGNQGSASLPVVAPGIAEALITTIVGLAVAIPAVIFYNFYMHRVERIEDTLDEARDMLLLRLKRETMTRFFAGSGEAR